MRRNRRQTLLQYWTTRYLITLFIGLIIIGILSTLLIRHNATQQRLESLTLLAEDIADSTVAPLGQLVIDPFLSRRIERTQRFLQLDDSVSLLIIAQNGTLLYTTLQLPPLEIIQEISIPQGQEHGVQEVELKPGYTYLIVKQAIQYDNEILGYVVVFQPTQVLPRTTEEYQLLAMMLGGLAALGWLIIYTLTRNLTKPVKDVAAAAKQIVTGNYNLNLAKNPRELEIYELIQSFQDMAEKLRQLEALRTELLAGVTHELKTPVTAISGLIQAVKDEVVTGQEAQEFLEICSRETNRLQKMVEDLLDFNSFATGDIKVNEEQHDLNQLIQEIIYQWRIGQEDNNVIVNTKLVESPLVVNTDPMRLQQILYNLFNNAQQAFAAGGIIDVILSLNNENVTIDVQDNGPGIPAEEQDLIFERFFRGTDKKERIRGLGLGLTFSKLIARALGGDLLLKSSTPEGTTFTLVLPQKEKI